MVGYSWEMQPAIGISWAWWLGGWGGWGGEEEEEVEVVMMMMMVMAMAAAAVALAPAPGQGFQHSDIFSEKMLLLLPSTSFAPGENRNSVYPANITRAGKRGDCSLLMLCKSPLSVLLLSGCGGLLWLAWQTTTEPSSQKSAPPQGHLPQLEPEVLPHSQEVLLFLLLAEQSEVHTENVC